MCKTIYAILTLYKITFTFYKESGYDVFEYLGNKVQVNDDTILLNGVITNIQDIKYSIKEAADKWVC